MRLATADRPCRSPRRRLALVAMVALSTLLAAACSNSDSDATPTATVDSAPPTDPTTTTAAATTTTTAPTPEEEVEAAYLRSQLAFYEVARDPDPDDPALEEATVDPNLAFQREAISSLVSDGLRAEFPAGEPPRIEVLDVALSGSAKALVESCTIDDVVQVRVSDDSVANDAVSTRLSRADMRLVDGAWKVYSQERLKKWEDGNGCDR